MHKGRRELKIDERYRADRVIKLIPKPGESGYLEYLHASLVSTKKKFVKHRAFLKSEILKYT